MANTNQNFPQGARGIFIPAPEWAFPDGTWTLTRAAAGNYYMLKTAGAATTHPAVNLQKAIKRLIAALLTVNAPMGGELQEGGIFTGFDLVYSIATAALTSITPATYETLYKNATANAVSSPGGAVLSYPTTGVAAPVATQATPYVVGFQMTTPYLIGQNLADVSDWLELAVVDPGTSVFALYGAMLKFNANQ
jgi:hypothetical protein